MEMMPPIGGGRRLSILACIAVMALCGSCTSSRPSASGPPRTDPAADAAPTSTQLSTPPTTAGFDPAPAARPCGAADLSAQAPGSQGLAGSVLYPVTLINESATACHLGGYPTGLRDLAHSAVIPTSDVSPTFPLAPGNLQPGATGQLDIQLSDSCDHRALVNYSRFAVIVAGGAVPVTVGQGQNVGPLSLRCGTALLAPMGVPAPPQNACQLDQVSISVAKTNPGSANQPSEYIGIRNTSAADCNLSGYPGVAADHADGTTIDVLHQGSYEIRDPGITSIDLHPGQTAYFGVGWLDANPPCTEIQTVAISLPYEPGSVQLPVNINACGQNGTASILDVTAIGNAAQFTGGTPPP